MHSALMQHVIIDPQRRITKSSIPNFKIIAEIINSMDLSIWFV